MHVALQPPTLRRPRFDPMPIDNDRRKTFREIVRRAGLNPEGKLGKAFEIASAVHRDEKRKDKITPYIDHPLGVLDIVLNGLGGTEDAGCVGLIHDTGESGPKNRLPVSYFSLLHEVNPQVARGAAYLTDPRCVGPLEKPDNNGNIYRWVLAHMVEFTRTTDYLKKIETTEPDLYARIEIASYREKKKVYLER